MHVMFSINNQLSYTCNPSAIAKTVQSYIPPPYYIYIIVLRNEKRGLQLVFHVSTLQNITQPLFNQFS